MVVNEVLRSQQYLLLESCFPPASEASKIKALSYSSRWQRTSRTQCARDGGEDVSVSLTSGNHKWLWEGLRSYCTSALNERLLISDRVTDHSRGNFSLLKPSVEGCLLYEKGGFQITAGPSKEDVETLLWAWMMLLPWDMLNLRDVDSERQRWHDWEKELRENFSANVGHRRAWRCYRN